MIYRIFFYMCFRCLVNYKWLFIISLYEVLKVHYNKYSLRLLIKNEAGSHLLSHTVSSAVPSAAYVLTIVFGMGTGVTRKRITTGKFVVIHYTHAHLDFASLRLDVVARSELPYASMLFDICE